MTKRPTPTEDGAALFEAAMRDVVRHRKPARAKGEHAPAPQAKAGELKPRPATPLRHQPAADSAPPRVTVERTPAPTGLIDGVDKRTAERFRRGRMGIDARLDLHGHTQADAHRALHAFIRAAHGRGDRCVLVITGKGAPREREELGFMPDRDSGVLRRNVPRWLAETPVRGLVLGVENARTQHGGGGAYYVLLRRKR
jgi:DNA-nicking Smr family endonuclease